MPIRMLNMECPRGVSLVEIMVFVAFLAVLAGLAVPAWIGLSVRNDVVWCIEQVQASTAEASSAIVPPEGQQGRRDVACEPVSVRPERVVVRVAARRASVAPVFAWSRDAAHQDERWSCTLLEGDPRHFPAQCRATEAADPIRMATRRGSG